jgi:lipopolysaccharide/colanic/teichoic acid biosynthesis glycosyltransferase
MEASVGGGRVGADTVVGRDSAKRVFDLAIAMSFLVILAPLMLAIAFGLKLDSRGPVLYRSLRVGLRGREFRMLKFRKMHNGVGGPALTSASDQRFTRFGSFLARTKLDEVPQLWNVIRGDMSLVGPRPEDPRFVEMHPDQFADILRVRPGITGLSQLAFASEARLLDVPDRLRRYVESLLPQKIALDRMYVSSRSIAMDVRVLGWTFLRVLFGVEVSVNRGTGRLTIRRRRETARAPEVQRQESS